MRFWIRILVVAASLQTLQLMAQNLSNPVQVALLRWYGANAVTQFATCAIPQGLAFDRVHVWVACGGSGNELQEFNFSDGTLVATITGIVSPYSLVYDGANIWATNPGSGTVTEVAAATGSILGTFAVGTSPTGITFDGQYIWVTNSGSNSISKILATTGGVAATYSLSACSHPWSAVFDGTNVWVVCHNTNTILQVSPTGSVLHTVTVGTSPTFASYDGEVGQTNGPFIWVTNNASATVSKVSVATHSLVANYSVGSGPYGVAFDGAYIWVANGSDNTVTKLTQSTGAQVAGSPFSGATGAPLSAPVFVAFDGGNMWISNTSSGTVSKF